MYTKLCIHNTKISVVKSSIYHTNNKISKFSVPNTSSSRANKQSDHHHECSFLSPDSLTDNLGMDLSLGSKSQARSVLMKLGNGNI